MQVIEMSNSFQLFPRCEIYTVLLKHNGRNGAAGTLMAAFKTTKMSHQSALVVGKHL